MMRPKNYEKPISQNKFTKDVSLSAFPCFASDGYSGIGIKKTAEAMADALHDILSVRHHWLKYHALSAEQILVQGSGDYDVWLGNIGLCPC